MHNLAAEVERARSELERDRFSAVERLRELEERWARSLLGLSLDADLVRQVGQWVEGGPDVSVAAEAARHLAAAERWQWEIGTWATGSGEGLASMAEVRALQTARAWLCAATGDAPGARALIAQVEGDPNRLGAAHADSLRALERILRGPSTGPA